MAENAERLVVFCRFQSNEFQCTKHHRHKPDTKQHENETEENGKKEENGAKKEENGRKRKTSEATPFRRPLLRNPEMITKLIPQFFGATELITQTRVIPQEIFLCDRLAIAGLDSTQKHPLHYTN